MLIILDEVKNSNKIRFADVILTEIEYCINERTTSLDFKFINSLDVNREYFIQVYLPRLAREKVENLPLNDFLYKIRTDLHKPDFISNYLDRDKIVKLVRTIYNKYMSDIECTSSIY